MTNSCLAQSSRKRKRLHVSFCTQPQNIIYTYSQSDYDRSGSFPDFEEQQQSYILALKINFIPQLPKKLPETPNKRPKLTIDTSNLSGPLYFTNMTTNHQKKKIEIDNDVDIVTRENTRRNSLPSIL